MENPANNALFSSDFWNRALESYGSVAHLTVKLFDAEGCVVFGPVNPTPFFQLFNEMPGYEPGIFGDCARRCLAQTGGRPAVVVSEFFGLSVVGTSLVLDSKIVGAAVGGYAFLDFCQASEIQRLARNSGIGFERLWQLAREQKPVPKQRLLLNGELLQVLGDAILRENSRTRRYGAALSHRETQLHALTTRLITSQEDERRRIARELHDDLTQRLVTLLWQVDGLRLKTQNSDGELGEHLKEIGNQLGDISNEVRVISHGLHPTILDDLGLQVAVGQLVGDFVSRTSQSARFIAENVPGTISTSLAITLYRIAQEALANVRKHASEASVTVTLSGLPGELRLVVEDNGPGLKDRQTARDAGLGFISMQERAQIVGGQIIVTSSPGQGVRIEAIIPWISI
jgi:signal transduction histidine kinase